MHIPQRTLRSFVTCFAILMLLPVAGTAIVGTGIVTLPLFFFTNTGALSCKPGNLWFGKVMVGGSNVLSARLSNTGTSNITISSVSVTGAGYSLSGLSFPMTLGPGNSAQFQVIFAPLVQGRVAGSIGFTSSASSSTLYVSLHGTGASTGVLSASPSSINFGTSAPGNNVTQLAALTNTGTASVTVQQISASGSGFAVSHAALPWTLASGQSATFSISFTPTAGSTSSGSVSIVSNAYDSTLSIPLTGAGASAGILSANPTSNSFGSVQVGSSASQYQSVTATLSASGSSVTVSSASTSNPEFSLSGVSFPLALAAGQSAPVSVTFTPQSSGTASGTISFSSNASATLVVEALTGTGVAQHQVQLSWGASSSSGVTGYNVYRGSVSGGPYTKINSALVVGTTYSDSSVQAGKAYFYVTTALNGSGTESAYSNEVQATVPSP